jgi:CRP-like cAMP-binding protein
MAEVARIGALSLFAGLSTGVLDEVAQLAFPVSATAGKAFFRQGEPASRFYVLSHGSVRLTQVTTDGQQVIVRFISPGEGFGLVAALSPGPYPLTAETVADSSAYAWSGADYKQLMDAQPALAARSMQMLADRVREMQDKSRELATERVERRVARALLRLASQSGVREGDSVVIDLPLTRQDIAEMAGTTPYSASRILAAWAESGIVLAGRKRVEIRRPHQLVAIAEDLPGS